jgi:N-acetylmuramoyl-L-alanine amidase
MFLWSLISLILESEEPTLIKQDIVHKEEVIPENKANQPKVIPYTPEEVHLVAKMVFAEAKGEPYEGQVAVAKVIFNRVNSHLYPNTVKEVLYQEGQFSSIANGAFQKAKPTELQFFFNPKTSEASNVRWFRDNTRYIKTIGNHEFRGY